MDGTPTGTVTTYRPVLSRVVAVVYVLVGVAWLAVAARDAPGDLLVLLPALVAGGAVAYALLWRPAVVVGPEQVRLLNVARDVTVPWAALEGVDTRWALTLETARGRHQSWAAAAPGRPQRSVLLGGGAPGEGSHHRLPDRRWTPDVATPDRSSRDLSAESGAAAFLVEQAWTSWRERPGRVTDAEAEGGVTVRWNVPVLAVAGVAALLAAVAGLLTS